MSWGTFEIAILNSICSKRLATVIYLAFDASSAGHGLYCCNVFKLEYMEELDQWDLLELFHPHEVTIKKKVSRLTQAFACTLWVSTYLKYQHNEGHQKPLQQKWIVRELSPLYCFRSLNQPGHVH